MRTEEKYDFDEKLTIKYVEMGCYDCEGHKELCPNYLANTPKFFPDIVTQSTKYDYQLEFMEVY